MKVGVRLIRAVLHLMCLCLLCWSAPKCFADSCQVLGNSSVCAGTTNTYTHSTDSTSTNFVYSWTLSTNTAGAFIIGDTNLSYVEVFSSSNGDYAVQLTLGTDEGDLTCETTTAVLAPPTASVLSNLTLCPGEDATFTTSVSGDGPFTFVWRKDGDELTNATTDSLTVSNATGSDNGLYRVEVGTSCGAVTNEATLTVIEPPDVLCPVAVTVACLADVPEPDTNAVVSTNAIQVLFLGDEAVTNGCEVVITRTYAAVNSCNATSPCQQVITVIDTNPPVLTCGTNFTVECGDAWDFNPPSATDICDDTNITVAIFSTQTNALCGNTYLAERIWIATDACSNSVTCTQTVTVVDTTAPVLACGTNFTVECGDTWDFTPPSAVDVCDGTNVTIAILSTQTNALCGNAYWAERIWIASDSCSNSVTCTQTVTVVDTTAPVLTCGTNFTVECGDAWDFTPPSAVDVCDAANITVAIFSTQTNALCGNTYWAERIWIATDSCSNSVTCTQTVTVVDTTAPVLTCGTNFTVECGDAWDFTPPSATDICDDTNVTIAILSTQTNALCGNTYWAERIWIATDSCSNSVTCTQTVTVVDTIRPDIFCSTNIVVECTGPAGTPVSFTVTAEDVCDTNVTVVATPPSGTAFPLGTNLVICVATDDCGNTNVCTLTVTVLDTTPPLITCLANIIAAEAPRDSGGAAVSFANPAVSDICDDAVQLFSSVPSGYVFPVGSNLVTWTAIDASGNSNSCIFSVRVIPYRLFVVTNTDDSGPGSLRQAVQDSNDSPDQNLILFNLPGAGLRTIHLLSQLPPITSPTIIDGWSLSGSNAPPLIELDGGGGSNAFHGLVIEVGNCTVRGLILNGFADAIRLETNGTNIIEGNWIGTGAGNAGNGIYIASKDNLIGGSAPGTGNIISGNASNGIHLDTTAATQNRVVGNFIGLASDGLSPFGNGLDGVRMSNGAATNWINHPFNGMGNTIAFNGRNGVGFDPTAGIANFIFGNSIVSNSALGIDLGNDGVTANDVDDADSGPNGLQNFPVLSDARSISGITTIDGILTGIPNTRYRVDFYLNDTADPSGYGEGQIHLGAVSLQLVGNGQEPFATSFPLTAVFTQFVTATATDPAGSTSEFSPAVQVRTPPVLEVVPVSTNTVAGGEVTFCASASGTPPISFQWKLNGQNIPGATNACLTIPSVEVPNAGAYSVVVYNVLGGSLTGQARLALSVSNSIAAGDNFADRVPLTGASGSTAGSNQGATREPGEPKHADKPGGKSVWYTWSPPFTGIATIGTRGSDFDTLLGVYTGTNVTNLVVQASDEDGGGFFTSGIRFNAIKKGQYHFAIDGYGGDEGEFIFGWSLEDTSHLLPVILTNPASQTAPPGSNVTFTVVASRVCGNGHANCPVQEHYPHEQFPNLSVQWFIEGQAIPGATNYSLTVFNVQEVNAGRYVAQVTAWYQGDSLLRVVESQAAELQINVTGFGFSPVRAWDKLPDALLDAPWLIGILTQNAPSGGPSQATISTVVSGFTGTQVFNTGGGTTSAAEDPICGVLGGASEWLTLVPTESGFLFLDTDGSSYDTVMAAFLRLPNGSLQYLACDNNGGTDGIDSSLVIPVTAGQTNVVLVDGVNGASGTLRLNYSLVAKLSIQALGTTTQGAARLRITGRDNMNFKLLRSSDLIHWTEVLTTNSPTAVLDVTDPSSPANGDRYYRAQLLP